METSNSFELTYNTGIIKVTKQYNNSTEIFHIIFSTEVPAMDIALTGRDDNGWDTVPPGNPVLATAVGKLIDEYYEANADNIE